MKKCTYPIPFLVKTSHKKNENPQNDKKEIENFKTSKQQNKKPSKFPKEKKISYFPLVKLHTKNLKTPKITRRKLKIQEFQILKTKNF